MNTHTESSVKIYFSKDYGRFKLLEGNRLLNARKIAHIRKAVFNGLDYLNKCPILVYEEKGRLCIIDGQHRFMVSKSMERPVWYILCDKISLKDIALLNSNAERWKKSDYIHCFASQGVEDYQVVGKFIQEFKLPVTTSLYLLYYGKAGSGGVSRDINELFKLGSFKVKFKAHAWKTAEAAKGFYKFTLYKNRLFITAVSVAIGEVNLDRAIEKSRSGELFKPQNTVEGYLTQLKKFA